MSLKQISILLLMMTPCLLVLESCVTAPSEMMLLAPEVSEDNTGMSTTADTPEAAGAAEAAPAQQVETVRQVETATFGLG